MRFHANCRALTVVPLLSFFVVVSGCGGSDGGPTEPGDRDDEGPSNQPPTASISAPEDGATFAEGEEITFEGSAEDPEDGSLTGNALTWESSQKGQFGTGEKATISSLANGDHTITLTATDSEGASDEASVDVSVSPPPLFDIFVQIPSASASTSVVSAPDFSVQLEDDLGNSLNINEGQVVVREMELGRETGECVDNEDASSDDGDACTEVTVEPRVLALPVDRGEAQIVANLRVEAADYDRLEFDIHVATDDDQQIVSSNPQLRNRSVSVQGSFNGSTFTGTFDPEASLSLGFPSTVEADPGSTNQITLVATVEEWFRRDDGSLINPGQVENGSATDQAIESRIENSFSVQIGSPQ